MGTIQKKRHANFWFLGPPPPFVTHSRNLSVLFVRIIGQFLNPLPPQSMTSFMDGPQLFILGLFWNKSYTRIMQQVVNKFLDVTLSQLHPS